MFFKKIEPAEDLKNLVKEYWIYENSSEEIEEQKIIPDGFCEIVIHYGQPYMINIAGKWETQTNLLFAGQINKYFYLRNTGCSGMIGIKLYPEVPYRLFGCQMSQLVDKVVPLQSVINSKPINLLQLTELQNYTEKIKAVDKWIREIKRRGKLTELDKIESAVRMILDNHGLIQIETIATRIELGKRHFERKFKETIGLTPKFYSRIIRFNYIFELINEGNEPWLKVALQSGYFDQSHFIKNFKEFTGEEPTNYDFDDINMANFFLKKYQ